jgi:hypothetical protein
MSRHKVDYRPQGEPGAHGHEPTDDDIRKVLASAAALVVVCICALTFLSWLMRGYQSEQRAGDSTRPPLFADDRGQFPEPRLQENPHADLRAMRAADHAELSSYGWVDRKSGIAKIPIGRAIEIVANRGLPQAGAKQESKPGEGSPKAGAASNRPSAEEKPPVAGLRKSKSEIPATDDAKSKGKPGGGGG